MPRPILATIRPAAVAHNLMRARAFAPHRFLWAVIKANAYGHGIERVYSGLHVADGVALLDIAEARSMRALGWDKPILLLEGCFDGDDIKQCHELALTPVVHSAHQLALHAAHPLPLCVHVKINTGMNRLGFALNQLPTQALLGMPHLSIALWMTHFADADATDTASALRAWQRFETAMQTVFAQHQSLRAPLSASNSAAIAALPTTHADAVRSGVMTYGGSPFAHQSAAQLKLQAAMTLSSQVIAIQSLQAGDTVGYGSTFVADQPMRIGVVACGYADGYPRHAPTGTPVLVDGWRTRLIGRVSMDMLTVDITGLPTAAIGSAVELWGEHLSIDEVAQSAGTIGYELMCALAPRVPVLVQA